MKLVRAWLLRAGRKLVAEEAAVRGGVGTTNGVMSNGWRCQRWRWAARADAVRAQEKEEEDDEEEKRKEKKKKKN